MNEVGSVKKWDNRLIGQKEVESLPRFAFWSAWFSKTGQGLKSKSVSRWERYPLFKRQRLLLLVFLLFNLLS
jgi:hypothetical protein